MIIYLPMNVDLLGFDWYFYIRSNLGKTGIQQTDLDEAC